MDSNGSGPFDMVRRGYDRRQVDEHLHWVSTQLAEVRVAAQREQRRAERAEREVADLRGQLERKPDEQAPSTAAVSEPDQTGFGYRVERLLRAAEDEANEVRSRAAREATAVLERAREDAETHRHHVEQNLIARTAALEEEGARRDTELHRREYEVEERIASAREESNRMLAEVRLESDRLRQEAADQVARERTAAEEQEQERRVRAERELDRLRGMHDEVRAQLARLLEALAKEFGMNRVPHARAQTPRRAHDLPHPRSTAPQAEAAVGVADTQPTAR